MAGHGCEITVLGLFFCIHRMYAHVQMSAPSDTSNIFFTPNLLSHVSVRSQSCKFDRAAGAHKTAIDAPFLKSSKNLAVSSS